MQVGLGLVDPCGMAGRLEPNVDADELTDSLPPHVLQNVKVDDSSSLNDIPSFAGWYREQNVEPLFYLLLLSSYP